MSQKDVKVDVATEEGATALSVAALRGNADLVDIFLEKDINLIEMNMINGYGALHNWAKFFVFARV